MSTMSDIEEEGNAELVICGFSAHLKMDGSKQWNHPYTSMPFFFCWDNNLLIQCPGWSPNLEDWKLGALHQMGKQNCITRVDISKWLLFCTDTRIYQKNVFCT